MKRGFSCVLFFCIWLNVHCTRYYVNNGSLTGDVFTTAIGNNANAGTSSLPFATLGHALGVVAAGDTIFVDAGTYADNNLAVNLANITIIGAGSNLTTFNNNFASTNTNYLVKVTGNGFKLQGIMAIKYNTTNVGEGRCITINGATGVVLRDVVLTNNDGSGGGNAALYIAANSAVRVIKSSFSCNPSGGTVNDYGGGVDVIGRNINVLIDSTSLSNNGGTSWYGAGIYITSDSSTHVLISNCSLSGNKAIDGGALYMTLLSGLSSSTPGPALTVSNSCFNNNSSQDVSAFSYGGALTVFSGTALISNCSFTSNSGGVGGAIAAYSSNGVVSLTIDSSYFSGNTTTQGNGGKDLYADEAFSHLVSVTGTQNTFSAAAGAIINGNSAVVSFSNSGQPSTAGTTGTVNFVNTIAATWATVTSCPAITGACVCQLPVITGPSLTDTICSGSTFTAAFTSTTSSTYTTYAWTSLSVPSLSGHSTSGTGNISETLTNNTDSVLTVLYTVTPTFNGLCSGNPVVYRVSVSPKPSLTAVSPPVICSGNALNIQLAANISSSFLWVAANNPNTTGESLTQQTGQTINDLLINASSTSQTVVYTVTPVSVLAGCTGNAQTINVTLNPAPVLTITDSLKVCSGAGINIALAANISSSFSWVATNNPLTTGQDTILQISPQIADTIYNNTTAMQTVLYTVTPVSVAGNCSGAAQNVRVKVYPEPRAAIITPDTITCKNPGVAVVATSTLQGSLYNWSTGSSLDSVFAILPGAYSVTVTGPGSNCTAVATATVLNNIAIPDFSLYGADTLTCKKLSDTLTVSSAPGSTVFQWSNGVTGTSDIISTTGNYTVVATDTINGCSVSAPFSIYQNKLAPVLQISPASTLTCAVTSKTISVSTSSFSASYSWNNGILNSSFITDTAGNYAVTVTNNYNGCSASASTSTSQDTTAPTANIQGTDTITCIVTSVTLVAATNITGANYTWSNGATTGSVSVQAPGIYSVRVTNPNNGCSTSATTSVAAGINTLPYSLAIATLSDTVCIGATLHLTATAINAASLSWTGPAGFTSASPNISIPALQLSNAGVYTVTATNTCGSISKSVTVYADSVPVNAQALASATLLCSGTLLTLNGHATAANSYAWSGPAGFNAATEQATITHAFLADSGYYIFTATNQCGSTHDSVHVTIDTLVQHLQSAVSPNDTVCSGAAITLSATGSNVVQWMWSGPGGFTTLQQDTVIASSNVVNSGLYILTASNICGSKSDTLKVRVEDSVTALAASSSLTGIACAGQTIHLSAIANAADNYSWIGPMGFSQTLQNPTINNISLADSGTYIVTASNVCGAVRDSVYVLTGSAPFVPIINTSNGSNLFCQGQQVELWASAANTDSVFWTTPVGNVVVADTVSISNIQPADTGLYVLSSVNTCGVSADSIYVSVHLLPGNLAINSASDSICPGASLILSAANAPTGITWSNNSHADTLVIYQPGNYYYTSRDTNGCIQLSDTMKVYPASPPVLDLFQIGAANLCTGQQSVTLKATSDLNCNVTWYPGAIVADSIIVSAPGQYNVVVTKNGCTTFDSTTVIQAALPQVYFTDTNITTCCTDITLQPIVSPGLLVYHWSDRATSDSDFVSTSGTYQITVTTTAGCTATASVNFNKVCIHPTASAEPDTVMIENPTNLHVQTSISQGLTYYWQPANNIQNPDSASTTAYPKENTRYTVFVTDSASGCIDSSVVTVVVTYTANFAIPNVFTPNGDGNNDTWYVVNQGGLVTVQDIKIFDRWGELVFSSERDGSIEWNGQYQGKLQLMGNYVYNVHLKINATNEEKFLVGNLALLW